MSDVLALLADQAEPPQSYSRWYCDVAGCNGEPHGPHWRWCQHACDAQWSPQREACSLSCGRPESSHHAAACRHARAAQVPPDGDWFVWMLLTGRGFGKSRAASEWLIDSAWNAPPAEWAAIGRNAADVRKNATDLTAGLEPVARRDGRLKQYNRHENDIYLLNGAVIHCLSADKPDRFRGFNLAGAWADELATWRYAVETWDYGLMPALRAGAHPRVVVTTTPRPVPLLRKLVQEAQAEVDKKVAQRKRSKVITTGKTWDNAANLAENFIGELSGTYGGTRVGRQELEGELLFDVSGALVDMEMIEAARNRVDGDVVDLDLAQPEVRVELCTHFDRVVIGVDPAGTYGEDSDETGIVVCAKGKGPDGRLHGYVLEDLSCRAKPEEWARQVAKAWDRWDADCVVAERNMGQKLVESVIRSVFPNVRYKDVFSESNKITRFEPVAALYEQGRVHHMGDPRKYLRLEDQITTYSPDDRPKNTRHTSPDRLDALVHAFKELGVSRFGAGQGFMQYMRNTIEGRGDAVLSQAVLDRRTARQARVVARMVQGARTGPQRRQEGAQGKCQHRWRPEPPHLCAWGCGALRDAEKVG